MKENKFIQLIAFLIFIVLFFHLIGCDQANNESEGDDDDDNDNDNNDDNNDSSSIDWFSPDGSGCRLEYLIEGEVENYFIDDQENIHLIIYQFLNPGTHTFYAFYNGIEWKYEELQYNRFLGETSMFVESDGTVHITYLHMTNVRELVHLKKTGDIWFTDKIIEGNKLVNNKIFVESDGEIVVYYVDEAPSGNNAIYKSRRTENGWEQSLVLDGVWYLVDIAKDSSDCYHAIFYTYLDGDEYFCLHYANSETWIPECLHTCSYPSDGRFGLEAAINVDDNNEPIIAVDYETFDDWGEEVDVDIYLYERNNGNWDSRVVYDLRWTVHPFVEILYRNDLIHIAFCNYGIDLHSLAIDSDGHQDDFEWKRTHQTYLLGFVVDQSDKKHFFYELDNYTDSGEEDGIYHAICP